MPSALVEGMLEVRQTNRRGSPDDLHRASRREEHRMYLSCAQVDDHLRHASRSPTPRVPREREVDSPSVGPPNKHGCGSPCHHVEAQRKPHRNAANNARIRAILAPIGDQESD
jgi:hypothetical protein